MQKALPLLNDGGSIILTGSVASAKGTPAFWVYGATKAAIRNFVRAWTIELKDRRIRSNVLSPGPTETPLVDRQPPEAIARIVSTIPMGRMGSSQEIAKAALFLASMIPVTLQVSSCSSMAGGPKSDRRHGRQPTPAANKRSPGQSAVSQLVVDPDRSVTLWRMAMRAIKARDFSGYGGLRQIELPKPLQQRTEC